MSADSSGRFKQFSGEHPMLFALILTFLLLLFYILAAVFAQGLGTTDVARNLFEALGRLAGALIFALMIVRFRWQDQTGLSRLGGPAVWLLTAAVLVYEVATYVYPYLGRVDWASAKAAETAAAALNALMTGPLEEFPFRGLILYAFLRLWADTRAGLWKAVLLSAVFFGASHLVHILFGRPLPNASLIALNAALGGIYYAAILLRWRTIWPAVALHSGLNSLATIVATNTPAFADSVDNLLLSIIFQIPLVILGWYLISRAETKTAVPRPA